MDQLRVLDDLRMWASGDENIRLAVLTGLLARGDDGADELSDLDVELYVLDPRPLLDRRDWYKRFGQVLVVEELENPDWHPTRLIYYVDGKSDFMIAEVGAARRGVTYDRPYRVLLDKDGLSDHLHYSPDSATPPTGVEFSTCINWFYAAALMCAKCIVKDEPWTAKVRDWDLKTQLLQMIEWDHKVPLRLGLRHLASRRPNAGVDGRGRHRRPRSVLGGLFDPEHDVGAVRLSRPIRPPDGTYGEGAGPYPFDSDSVRREIDRLLRLAREHE